MAGNSNASKYDHNSIQVLEELEAVRKRPGMYIGSTDSRGLHHLVWEIVDNAIDEVLAGFGKEINVTIKQDNSIIVEDFGRGVPIGTHKSGVCAAEIIFTKLHAGGKFGDSGAYKVSGGLHGVGASVVNALSEFMVVTVNSSDKSKYRLSFSKGGKVKEKLNKIGTCTKTGTSVWFKPDHKMFTTTVFTFSTISTRLKQSAFLNKKLRMNLKDERSNKKDSFYFEKGIVSYVELLNKDKLPLHDIFFFETNNSKIAVEIALQFTKGYSENIISFVNNVATKDGGTHVTGFKTALTKIFNEHARRLELLKVKSKNLEGADTREGLTAIVSVRISEDLLQFEGQTKGKLGTPEAKSALETAVFENLDYYFTENANIAYSIIEKSVSAQNARDAARKARESARLTKTKFKTEANLSGKLSPAQTKNPEINELYLVEGDSAGGTAKQGRDRKFQAILPLRGKVINSEKSKIDDVLKNEEINTIIHTIGAGLGPTFNVKKSNYNKVIIMTDADTDGAHIQTLLLTFFFRYMRELVEAGKVYIALPPLYKISRKTNTKEIVQYAWTDEELQVFQKKYKSINIQRYKGLGEMNATQLWDTTMDPEQRTLVQVNIDDLGDADQRVKVLMGDKVEPRREWIENNVSFTNEDNFVIKE